MASAPLDQKGGRPPRLIQQIATGLSVVSVLLCTIVGSSVITLQEGSERTAARPTDTATALPVFPPTNTPTPTAIVVFTATSTATATAGPTPTATATPRPGETPPTPLPPTQTPTATAAATSTPIPTATPACQPPYGWQRYTVQGGDTLIRLALLHGTTVSAISQANCLQSDFIYRGQRLYLPPRQAAPTATPTRCAPSPPAGWVLYTVQPGDTLYGLALSRRTTLTQIMQVNCLTSYLLYANQQLYLPPAPPTPTPTWTLIPTIAATATPTATAPVTPTETVEPTPTSTVPITATATATVEPTPTAAQTPTATATIAPTTTPTVEPTTTVSPTVETTPTTTPLPTKTPEPTPTGGPTATETATATPTLPPTKTPVPTPTATTEPDD